MVRASRSSRAEDKSVGTARQRWLVSAGGATGNLLVDRLLSTGWNLPANSNRAITPACGTPQGVQFSPVSGEAAEDPHRSAAHEIAGRRVIRSAWGGACAAELHRAGRSQALRHGPSHRRPRAGRWRHVAVSDPSVRAFPLAAHRHQRAPEPHKPSSPKVAKRQPAHARRIFFAGWWSSPWSIT